MLRLLKLRRKAILVLTFVTLLALSIYTTKLKHHNKEEFLR